MRAALAVKDYSKIISFFLENPLQILRVVDTKKFIRANSKPTARDLLDAATNAEGIYKDVKTSIQKVLDVQPYIVQQEQLVPSSTKTLIKKLEAELGDAKNFGETKKIVKKFFKDKEFQNDGALRSGLGMAWNIIEDGSHHPNRQNVFYSMINTIVKGGISGGMYGAAGGSVASESRGSDHYSKVGSQAGGVGGATTGTIQAIGDILWKWLY